MNYVRNLNSLQLFKIFSIEHNNSLQWVQQFSLIYEPASV